MAKAAPAFQFYAEKFLAGTSAMSAAARGCYISMLSSSWAIGPIADSPRSIAAAMCLTPFDPPFEGLWDEVRPKWNLGQGGWTNAKLEEVRADQKAYSDRQADKGRKSAAAKRDLTGSQLESNRGLTAVQPANQPEGEPKSNPIDFDLRSENLELRTLPESESAPAPAPLTAHPRQQFAPSLAKSPKACMSHVWCSSVVHCVPAFVHGDLLKAIGGDAATREPRLKEFYLATEQAHVDGAALPPDVGRYWRDQFKIAFPPASEPTGTGSRSTLAQLLQECLLPSGAVVWFAGAELVGDTLYVKESARELIADRYQAELERKHGRPLTIVAKQAVSA